VLLLDIAQLTRTSPAQNLSAQARPSPTLGRGHLAGRCGEGYACECNACPGTQLLNTAIVNLLLVSTHCPYTYSQAAEVPPALLSLSPCRPTFALSWMPITRDHKIFQSHLKALFQPRLFYNSMTLFRVMPGAPGLLRDKAAAGLLWLFSPCSSQPPARSSALQREAKTVFLMGQHPQWHHKGLSPLSSTRGLATRCSNCASCHAGLRQGTGCAHAASGPSQLHLPFQRGPLFPEELAELVPRKISSHAFLTQPILLRLPE